MPKVAILDRLIGERDELVNIDVALIKTSDKNMFIKGFIKNPTSDEQKNNQKLLNEFRGDVLLKMGKFNRKIAEYQKYDELVQCFKTRHGNDSWRLKLPRACILKIAKFIPDKISLEKYYPSIKRYPNIEDVP
tara:strand:- start:828 stop:1226 length:399 start_codon:yes stop_codon:yes gene_type:complete